MCKFWLKSKVVVAGLLVMALGVLSDPLLQAIDWRAVLLALGVPEIQTSRIITLGGLAFVILRIVGSNLSLLGNDGDER